MQTSYRAALRKRWDEIMARRKRKPSVNEGVKGSEEIKGVVSSRESSADNEVSSDDGQETVTAGETQENRPEAVIEETAEIKAEALKERIETESTTLTGESETKAGMVTDAMPEFLRNANSTIRRDGPYANYSGNADVLRHKKREQEKTRGRRGKKARQKQRSEGFISTETISLIALVIILGTIFFCAIRHVEMKELSLTVLLITAVITIVMGVLLGDAPSYVTLILVALIIIAGAVTGMFSEVITGVIIFLGTVLAIKGRFE